MLRNMFYAVKCGRQPGVYMTWSECENQVKKFPNCAYKKFNTEKEAWDFVNSGNSNNPIISLNQRAHAPNNNKYGGMYGSSSGTGFANKLIFPTPQFNSSSKGCYYAVHRGNRPGVYGTWVECEKQIANFKNASYRKFISKEEAEEFVRTGGIKKVPKSEAKRLKVNSDFEGCENVSVDDIHLDPEVSYNVFTDGASSKNGRIGAAAGIGIYWGPNHPLNVSQRLAGRQTNNRAEIYAATYALRQAKQFGAKKINLYTDSQFMIKGITQWIDKWKKNGWLLSNHEPVKNKDDFIELDKAREGLDVEFIYIKAHAHLPGNTEADGLAVEGAQKDKSDAFVILT